MEGLYFLQQNNIAAWLGTLMAGARLIAPVSRSGELLFDYVNDVAEVILGTHNTRRSPKWVFFPQTESLLRYKRKLDDYAQADTIRIETDECVLLGVAPCDARSFLMLDRVFGQGTYRDPYYCARRAATLVVVLACGRPTSACFCHAFGSAPDDPTGADVLLSPADAGYVVRAVSEPGHKACAAWQLPLASSKDIDGAAAAAESVRAMLQPIEPVTGIEHDLAGLFESGIWREIAEKCIACGTCTYNCPECHCFNIVDLELASGGERLRTWDGCMYPGFTLHASGYNPRPDQGSRWRQRVMHKFSYLPENVNLYGCVGCGRCVISCPVRLDIRQVLERVRAEARHSKAAQTGKEQR